MGLTHESTLKWGSLKGRTSKVRTSGPNMHTSVGPCLMKKGLCPLLEILQWLSKRSMLNECDEDPPGPAEDRGRAVGVLIPHRSALGATGTLVTPAPVNLLLLQRKPLMVAFCQQSLVSNVFWIPMRKSSWHEWHDWPDCRGEWCHFQRTKRTPMSNKLSTDFRFDCFLSREQTKPYNWSEYFGN